MCVNVMLWFDIDSLCVNIICIAFKIGKSGDFSHLLDKKKPKNYIDKLKIMKEKFKSEYYTILKENKKCDNIANKTLKELKKLPNSFYGLPKFTLSSNDKTYTHSSQIIPKRMSQTHRQLLASKEKRRSQWIESGKCNINLTIKSKSIQFQRIFPKLSQNLMFTKKRAYPYYQRATKLPPLMLQKRQEAYNNETL